MINEVYSGLNGETHAFLEDSSCAQGSQPWLVNPLHSLCAQVHITPCLSDSCETIIREIVGSYNIQYILGPLIIIFIIIRKHTTNNQNLDQSISHFPLYIYIYA